MRIVTYNAIPTGYWTVDIFLIRHVVFMAIKTENWKRGFREQKLVVRLVGIMTDYTFAFLNR